MQEEKQVRGQGIQASVSMPHKTDCHLKPLSIFKSERREGWGSNCIWSQRVTWMFSAGCVLPRGTWRRGQVGLNSALTWLANNLCAHVRTYLLRWVGCLSLLHTKTLYGLNLALLVPKANASTVPGDAWTTVVNTIALYLC